MVTGYLKQILSHILYQRSLPILICIISIHIHGFGQSSYQEKLDSVLCKIKFGLKSDAKDICSVIPATQEEYLLFYHSREDSGNLSSFYMLNNSIYDYRNKDLCVLYRYLNMSEFVDGEFAESYFDGIDYFYLNNKLLFKKTYKKLKSGAKKRLKVYTDKKWVLDHFKKQKTTYTGKQ